MSPDLYFALTLIVKMAITAAFVLAATMTAERAGPLVGGLVATLPIGAGPVYVFLALDHDAHFIAQSAVASLAVNAVNVIFAVTYALLAQRRSLAVSLGGAFVVWIVLDGDRNRQSLVAWSRASDQRGRDRLRDLGRVAVRGTRECRGSSRAGTTTPCAR